MELDKLEIELLDSSVEVGYKQATESAYNIVKELIDPNKEPQITLDIL